MLQSVIYKHREREKQTKDLRKLGQGKENGKKLSLV